jgi:hypothetical protein
MATVDGNTFIFYQGDNPDLEFNIVDDDVGGDPYDLTGGMAVLTYWKGSEAAVNKTCTIATTKATASFTHAVTQLMIDLYPFQLVCKNAAGKQVMTRAGFIQVLYTKDPDAVGLT